MELGIAKHTFCCVVIKCTDVQIENSHDVIGTSMHSLLKVLIGIVRYRRGWPGQI